MKHLYTSLIFLTLLACTSSQKSIYEDNNINNRKLENLWDAYAKAPGDTALQRQVLYAYRSLETDLLNDVNKYRYGTQPAEKEKLYKAYVALQQFYDKARTGPASSILQPSSVGTEMEQAKLAAVQTHYQVAGILLENNNWRDAREAYQLLQKTESWMPGYENTKQLMREAREGGIVDAVVLPLSADGFYYRNNNFFGQPGYIPQLHQQLARDLGGRYGNNNSFRVWAENGFNQFNSSEVDWTIEPVWNYLRYNEPRIQQRQENRSKQIEIGRDTSNRPLYKTVRATVYISEQVVEVNGTLELRISDVVNRERISGNTFNESHRIFQRRATYTGDALALNNSDWQMINSQQAYQRFTEEYMEQVLLEKMYNNLLQHLRWKLNY